MFSETRLQICQESGELGAPNSPAAKFDITIYEAAGSQ
jgi:hypothetical protein